MEKTTLKTLTTSTVGYVDMETGEIVDIATNKVTYLSNTKEEFFLMYSSMVVILKSSSDVRMKLFAALLERYSQGQEFVLTKYLKETIAQECNCKPRSFEKAFTTLIKDNIIVKLDGRTCKINPRHVFKGSSSNRNEALKAIIELGCKDC